MVSHNTTTEVMTFHDFEIVLTKTNIKKICRFRVWQLIASIFLFKYSVVTLIP
jgi:hypothetical protein